MSSKPGTKTPPKGQSTKPNNAVKRAAPLNPQVLAAQEARKQTMAERQQEARIASQRRRRAATIRNTALVGVALVLLVGGLLYILISQANQQAEADRKAKDYAANPPGELVAQQASQHIKTVSDAHDPYTTDPPTSGPHVPQVPNWGVMTTQIPKELQVHALEDAGVVVNYKPDLDKATVDRLAALVKSYSDHAIESKTNFDNHVLMTPYTGLDHAIVLTAWTRIARFDTFDEAKIKRFIDAYKNIDHHSDSGS